MFFIFSFSLFITLDCIEQEQGRRLKVGLVAMGVLSLLRLLLFSSCSFSSSFFSFRERVSNVAAAAYSWRPSVLYNNWTPPPPPVYCCTVQRLRDSRRIELRANKTTTKTMTAAAAKEEDEERWIRGNCWKGKTRSDSFAFSLFLSSFSFLRDYVIRLQLNLGN